VVTSLYIGPVGFLSGRCINAVQTRIALETSGQVGGVRTSNLTIRPLVSRASGRNLN
jgi:hypothetical protein